MSSLRRRAICVQRARSIARSSIGGRASARTTAPASPGSTSSRSQASRSRTSARWKNAAAPASRYGTARSSSATATAWPSPRDRAHEHADVLGRDARARDEPLDVGRDRLRLRALVGAAPEARPRRRACAVAAACPAACSAGATTARAGGDDARARAEALGQPHDGRLRPLGAEVGDVLRRGAAEAVDRLVVVGRDREVRRARRRAAGAAGPAAKLGVLELVDEHVVVARATRARDVRLGRAAARNACRTRSPKSSVPPRRASGRGRRRSRRTRARARRALPRPRAASRPTPRSRPP